jgi:hypothetical protein
VLIIISIISISLLGSAIVGSLLALSLLAVNLVFALHTSQAPRKIVRTTLFLAAFAVVLTAAPAAAGIRIVAFGVDAAIGTVLTLVTSFAIGKRLAAHPVVNAGTIMGALCVYLLAGLSFAYFYRLLAWFGMDPYFVQIQHPRAVDYAYFSFVTLTTVGYGDLTVTHDLARMLAITEALLGQFYLVTVVALLVSRAGSRRQRDEAVSDERDRPRTS